MDVTDPASVRQALDQVDRVLHLAALLQFACEADPAQAVRVNIDDECNAFSDGTSINFFRESDMCSNTGTIADVVYHEFGHSLGGLADEYYSSQVSYEDFVAPGTEPWEPNVTALLDPSRLKWADLVAPGTPLPTPWGKEAYDAQDLAYQARRKDIAATGDDAAAEALMAEVKRATKALLEAEAHFGQVGAFEGASYEPKGLFRPEVDCIMFTRNPTTFCRVCARAIGRVIDLYAR